MVKVDITTDSNHTSFALAKPAQAGLAFLCLPDKNITNRTGLAGTNIRDRLGRKAGICLL
jgi:hypothetical protein